MRKGDRDEEIGALIRRARQTPMSTADIEAQRRSLTYGNLAIENPRVTRALVDQVADRANRAPSK